MMRALPVLIGLGLLAGCPPSDTGIGQIVDNPRVTSLFEVEPNLLTFGPLERETSETQTFTVRNIGDTRIEVRTVGISGATAFSLIDTVVPMSLEVEEEAIFTVQYDAANMVDQGTVTITVDAGGEGADTVELVGETEIPVLEVSTVDLGSTKMTCPDLEQPLVIRNVGSAIANVDQILLAAAPSGFITDPVLPLTIAPGAFVEFPISMGTDMVAVTDGAAFVNADDPASPHEVDVLGQVSVGDDPVIDIFNQPEEIGKIDILFTIDQSCSMEQDIQQLTASMGTLAAELGSFEADWQAAIVPFFNGCHSGGYLTKDTPDLVTAFQDAALHIGQAGADDTERGIEMARDAVVDTSGCNAGFIREDSKLAVIMLSDERDQSRAPWEDLVSQVNGVVPGTQFHGIVGGPELDLWDFNEQGIDCAERGEGYIQAVQATGGILLDVCEDNWEGHAEALGEGMGELASGRVFRVSHEAVPDTVVVYVDGEAVETGWTYDADRRLVTFDEPPAGGSSIRVEYTDADAC
ncbi:MAG: hypothetical protein KC912_00540 [Proteobacteria bacterium]|nr:hypothetical protein [Pseudomonadota bacterium]